MLLGIRKSNSAITIHSINVRSCRTSPLCPFPSALRLMRCTTRFPECAHFGHWRNGDIRHRLVFNVIYLAVRHHAMSFRPSVVCADIGSVAKGNFGWYSDDGSEGESASSLASCVSEILTNGQPVALGFECPLFVLLREDERKLTSARPGEGSRAWSAGAGCGSLATGIAQVPWILSAIKRQLPSNPPAFLSWSEFELRGTGLLIWEAFVSGASKRDTHTADARVAVEAFLASLPDPRRANAISSDSPVYSLAGSALLRAGWSSDTALLESDCLVIRG